MGLFDGIMSRSSGADTNDIWNAISEPSQFQTVLHQSEEKPQLIYKHSHRCSICFVAKGNLEKAADEIRQQAEMHFLNVVKNREVSDAIASELDVRHESPQVILLSNGEVVWHASHGSIDADTILELFSEQSG